MTSQSARKRGVSLALFSVFGLAAASVAIPQAATAQDSVADATGLRANLEASLAEEQILAVNESLAATSVAQDGGTDEDSVVSVPIDEDFLGLHADVISSESTSDADGNGSEAEITGANLRLGDTEVLDAEVLRAVATCPTDGEPTADAQVVNLQLLDRNVDADADLPVDATVPVEVDVEDVVSAEATVTLRQIETADGDSASATALLAHVEVEAVLSDQEVVTADVGEIVLAEANCERPADTAGETAGNDPDGDDTDGDDGNGDDALPGAPDDEVTGGPSADELSPDSGPTEGGTEVTIIGEGLDEADQVTIDGEDVDFTVNEDGTEITFTTPGGDPGTVDVVVTFDDDSSDTLEVTYTEDGAQDGDAADGPSADELSPDSGPTEGGTEVTIIGEGLDEADQVTIDGEDVDFTVNEDGTEITFTTPGGDPDTVDVVVTFDDGSTDTLEFTYEDEAEVLSAGLESDGDDGTADDRDTTTADQGGALPATGSGTMAIATATALLLMAAGAHLLARREQATA